MKSIKVNQIGFVFKWHDEETRRFYSVMFNEKGDILNGISSDQEKSDTDTLNLLGKGESLDVGRGVVIVEKHLIVKNENCRSDYLILPEWILGTRN